MAPYKNKRIDMNALSVCMLTGLALAPLLSARALELNDDFQLAITPTDRKSVG